MSAPLLEAAGVVRRFHRPGAQDVRALDGVDLSVARGTFLAIRGPSGGGKSTLLAVLGALDVPTEGRVSFDGVELADASSAALTRVRRRIGFVFAHAPMLRRTATWENVACPLLPRGVPARERRERAHALLVRVGLAARAGHPPEALSAGELQRAALARALVGDPEALLADEPTAHLDPASARSVADLLAEVHATGTTLVVATHDTGLLARAGDVRELVAGRFETDRQKDGIA